VSLLSDDYPDRTALAGGPVTDIKVSWAAEQVGLYLKIAKARFHLSAERLVAETYALMSGYVIKDPDDAFALPGRIAGDKEWALNQLAMNLDRPMPFFIFQTIVQAANHDLATGTVCSFFWDRRHDELYVARHFAWGAAWQSCSPDAFLNRVAFLEGILEPDTAEDYVALGRELDRLTLPS
jgi:hypothetical protein